MHNMKMIIPENIKTALDSMTLLDRFLFNEAVEDFQTYNDMIEILLENQIHLIPWTETEKELRVSPELREVRLDVISMDEAGELYQMEMQQRNTYNLPKRSRYYQAQIDVSLLEPGSINFGQLNDLTTILVAPFDIFGYGLYRYTFEEQCFEVPELKLNDGAKRIFINTSGNNPENFSKEFLDFMKYIVTPYDEVVQKSGSEKIKRIHERVCTIKRSEKMGVKLMQKWEEICLERQWAREDGRAEGLAEGHKEGYKLAQIENAKRMLADNVPVETVVRYTELSKEEVMNLI